MTKTTDPIPRRRILSGRTDRLHRLVLAFWVAPPTPFRIPIAIWSEEDAPLLAYWGTRPFNLSVPDCLYWAILALSTRRALSLSLSLYALQVKGTGCWEGDLKYEWSKLGWLTSRTNKDRFSPFTSLSERERERRNIGRLQMIARDRRRASGDLLAVCGESQAPRSGPTRSFVDILYSGLFGFIDFGSINKFSIIFFIKLCTCTTAV